MHFKKDCIERVLKTFIQSALAYITVNLALVDFSDDGEAVKSALTGLAVAALAAGISAVMNIEYKEDNNLA